MDSPTPQVNSLAERVLAEVVAAAGDSSAAGTLASAVTERAQVAHAAHDDSLRDALNSVAREIMARARLADAHRAAHPPLDLAAMAKSILQPAGAS